mgnify:CR=1 FL=1
MSSAPRLSNRRSHGKNPSWTRPSWPIRLGIGILASLCLLGGSLTEVKRGDSVQAADEPRPPAANPATSPNAPLPSQGLVNEEYFEKKVRPILVERCQKCHNSQKAKGGLQLDSRAGFLRGGDSGPALNLLPQVLQHNGDIRMPPQGKLPQSELDILLRWLAAGAPWPQDRSPSATPSPSTPHTQTPARTHWAFQPFQRSSVPPIPSGTPIQNPIDAFVLARLQAVGLNLAPEADKATLLRRVYFDLIGLPPSPEELDAFLKDSHPDAYDRVVDRLLASPHYGERWARHWLDLVRYAETYGHEFDFDIPDAWRYRDYVIRAFNADLPYDRFLREQIAGDLLDDPRYDPQTGSNESLLATAFWWLGDAVHSPVDSRMDFADRIDNQIDVFGKAILGLTLGCARCHDHKFDPIPSRDYYALFGILASSRFHYGDIGDPRPLERLLNDLTAVRPPDRLQEHSVSSAAERSGETIPPPRPGSAWRMRSKAWEHFGADWRQRWDAIGLGLRPVGGEGFPHSGREAEALSAALRSPTFIIEHRYLVLRVAGRQAQARLILNGLQLIRDPIYGGLAKRIDHGEEFRWLVFDLHLWPGQPAYVELLDNGPGYFAIREAWFADTPPAAETGERVLRPPSAALEKDPHRRRCLELLEAACRNRPRAPVMRDGPGGNERLFIRGNPRQLGPEVPRGFLSLFPAPPVTSSGSGRRELADAVLGPARPLVARVFVNRLWQHHFGRGLVATPDDFGAHGEAPTHPELLDWLAEQFIASGWSIKHMHRLIVRSRTYRQASQVPAAQAELARRVDPNNHLLHRQNLRRLEAEILRDAVLAVSGRLDRRLGGPPVLPYLSEQQVGRGRPPSGPLDGQGRRSIYLAVRRNFLPALFTAFDYPPPFTTVGRRSVSNVPTQALVLWNNPFFREQARYWAERLHREQPHALLEQRLQQMYLAAFARRPTPEEVQAARYFLQQFPPSESLTAWTELAHVLFNSKEFLFIP